MKSRFLGLNPFVLVLLLVGLAVGGIWGVHHHRRSSELQAVYHRGEALVREGRYSEALTELNRVLSEAPDFSAAYPLRAQVYLEMGQTQAAISDLDAAIGAFPKDRELLLKRGAALRRLGRLAEALDDYSKVLHAEPDNTELLNLRAETYLEAGEPDNASMDYDRALSLDPSLIGSRLSRAMLYYDHGDVEAALSECARIIESNPTQAEAYAFRGAVLHKSGRVAEAAVDYREALKLNPEMPEVHCLLGLLYEKKGRTKNALKEYSRALEIDDRLVWALFLRGRLRRNMVRMPEALEDFDRLVEEFPSSSFRARGWKLPQFGIPPSYDSTAAFGMLLVARGSLLQRAGFVNRANEDIVLGLGKVLGIDIHDIAPPDRTEDVSSDNPEEVRSQAVSQLLAGQDHKAYRLLTGLLNENPGSAELRLFRAAACRRLGFYEIAIKDLESIQSGELEAEARCLLGRVLLDMRRPAEALEQLEKAVAGEPKSASAWILKGQANLALGRIVVAIGDMDQALTLEPSSKSGLYYRGKAYEAAGEPHRALWDYGRALHAEEVEGTDIREILVRRCSRIESLGPEATSPFLHLCRGRLLGKQGRIELGRDELFTAYSSLIENLKPTAEFGFGKVGAAAALSGFRRRIADAATFLANGRPDSAIWELSRAAELKPEVPEAYRMRARAYLDLGLTEPADHDVEEGLRWKPEDRELLFLQGLIWQSRGEHAAAVTRFEELLKSDPVFFDAHEALGRSLVLEESQSGTTPTRDDFHMETDDGRRCYAHFLMGRASGFYERGMPVQALEELDAAFEAAPGDVEVLLQRARLREQVGDGEAALADANRALAMEPNSLRGLLTRGELYLKRGVWDAVVQDATKALKRAPGNPDALRIQGKALLASGKPDRALSSFDTLIRSNPGRPDGYLGRAEARMALKNYGAAAADVAKALSLDSDLPKAYRVKGAVQRALGLQEAACESLGRALEYGGADPGLLMERGELYEETSQFDRALDDYLNALKSNAGLVKAAFASGRLAGAGVTSAQYPDPVASIDSQALGRDALAAYLAGLALGEADGGNLEEALERFRTALEAAELPGIRLLSGNVRLASHHPEEALAEYTLAMEDGHPTADPFYLRGKTYAVLHKPLEAIRDFETAIELERSGSVFSSDLAASSRFLGVSADLRLPLFLISRGASYSRAGGMSLAREDALEAYRMVIGADVAPPEPVHSLKSGSKETRVPVGAGRVIKGEIYLDTGLSPSGVFKCTKKIREHPESALAWLKRGEAYLALLLWDPALRDLDRALSINSKLGEAYLGRARALQGMGRHSEAVEDFFKAAEAGASSESVLFGLGRSMAFLEKEREIKLLERIKQVIDASSSESFADFLVGRGTGYQSRGEVDLAVSDYSEAIVYDPDRAIFHYLRGKAYQGLLEYDLAAKDFSKVVELAPKNGGAFFRKGLMHLKMFQFQRAEEAFTRAMELVGESPPAEFQRLGLRPSSFESLDPEIAEIVCLFSRGTARYKQGDKAHYLSDFEQAYRLLFKSDTFSLRSDEAVTNSDPPSNPSGQ